MINLKVSTPARGVDAHSQKRRQSNGPDETTLENLRGAIAEYDEIKRLHLECEPFEDFKI